MTEEQKAIEHQQATALAEAVRNHAQIESEARSLAIDLLLNRGLYSKVDTSDEVARKAAEKLSEASRLSFDHYCIGCKKDATFRINTVDVQRKPPVSRYAAKIEIPTIFGVSAVCQRSFHVYTYIFLHLADSLVKVGQHPSIAEISFGELKAIDKGLEQIDRQELGKALGLFAHDTALGAFVYLRRVFERMIQRAHERQSASGNPVEGFADMKMHERVAALKEELPEKVVHNSAVFSVLSIGLHELTEEQCAKHFPVMKAVLFQMLEQEEHKRLAAITARETEAALQKILADPKA